MRHAVRQQLGRILLGGFGDSLLPLLVKLLSPMHSFQVFKKKSNERIRLVGCKQVNRPDSGPQVCLLRESFMPKGLSFESP